MRIKKNKLINNKMIVYIYLKFKFNNLNKCLTEQQQIVNSAVNRTTIIRVTKIHLISQWVDLAIQEVELN